MVIDLYYDAHGEQITEFELKANYQMHLHHHCGDRLYVAYINVRCGKTNRTKIGMYCLQCKELS